MNTRTSHNILCMKLTAVLLAACLCLPALLAGCGKAAAMPCTVNGYKLNTYVSIKAYSAGANRAQDVYGILNEALALCDRYEQLFSRTRADSVLYAVNHHTRTAVPSELGELIQLALSYSRISDGAFDPTVGSVTKLWDFTSENPSVPDAEDIKQALLYVDYRRVHLEKLAETDGEDAYRIELPENTEIDLGAIAKGYIADRIREFLLEKGISRALINLGGNVLCIGEKEGGAAYNIAIQKPFASEGTPLVTLELRDCSAVTSGTYERFFYDGDNFYHHILDPCTGYPYDNGLTAVTIISKDSVVGDALSTTCFSLGLDKGLELIEQSDGIEAMFVTSDGSLHYSSGFGGFMP